MGGGRTCKKNGSGQRKKKTPFYRSPRIQPLAVHQPRYYRTERGTTVERYYRNGSGTTALRYYRGSLPCLLPLITEGFAVVATVLPPGGTTALPGGTTSWA